MTNFEKHKEDLMKIKTGFGVNKITNKVSQCFDLPCKKCIFREETACDDSTKLKWLYSDYKKPILTENDIGLIEILSTMKGKDYKFITRSITGEITLYTDTPFSHYDNGHYYYVAKPDTPFINIKENDKTIFPNIHFGKGIYDVEHKCFVEVCYLK